MADFFDFSSTFPLNPFQEKATFTYNLKHLIITFHSISASQSCTPKISLSIAVIHCFGILCHGYRLGYSTCLTRIRTWPIRTRNNRSVPLSGGILHANLSGTRHLQVHGKWGLVAQGASSLHQARAEHLSRPSWWSKWTLVWIWREARIKGRFFQTIVVLQRRQNKKKTNVKLLMAFFELLKAIPMRYMKNVSAEVRHLLESWQIVA